LFALKYNVTIRIDIVRVLPGLVVAGWLVGCGHAAYPGATVTVRNISKEVICDVYLSQVSGNWGEDLLEESERVEVNRIRSFDVAPGIWNVRADNCRGGMVFTRHDLRVSGHVLLQVRPVKASVDRKLGCRIAVGARPYYDM
jgi:hypothetical protein